jgi:cupin 2 domain-containing protein
MAMPPLFGLTRDLPAAGAEEAFQPLYTHNGTTIERIVSHGHASPPGFWYDQDHDEWVSLIAGEAILQFEEGEHRLQPGDSVLIPRHCRHRVAYTRPATVWLAVHLPPC